MSTKTEAVLLKQLGGTNPQEREQALTAIYEESYEAIEKMIVHNSGSVQDAEDIFHDALISFFKQVQNGLTLTCAIKTYLYSMSWNLWRNRLRKSGRSDQLDERQHDTVALDQDPQTFLVMDECARLLAAYLQQLGEDCRKVLVLSFYEYLSAEEIAQQMNYANAQIARNKKSKCLNRFRKLVFEADQKDQSLQQCIEDFK